MKCQKCKQNISTQLENGRHC